jgi:hypothetical protein
VIVPGARARRGSDKYLLVQDVLNASGSVEGGDRTKERPCYLYVWGAVRYDDGFNNMRTTKFCHRYNWIVRGQTSGNYTIDKKHARDHETGNDAT